MIGVLDMLQLDEEDNGPTYGPMSGMNQMKFDLYISLISLQYDSYEEAFRNQNKLSSHRSVSVYCTWYHESYNPGLVKNNL